MQLHLLVEKHYFGPGSRIILTSRDKQVLEPVVDEIYEVEKLNHNEALELFSSCAFKLSHPKEDYLELSKKVVDYAKGVPLAIRVLGSTLYGKSKLFWEGELKSLKEIPNPQIDHILRISFDGLDREAKDIFLDIACFFKGTDRDDVADKLDGCYISPENKISVLIDKSLITIQDKRLEMHNLVQQMAWNIVHQESKEPGKCSRLWTPKDICHVLKNNTGTDSVQGMFLDMSKISGVVCMSPTAFAKMHYLKFLKFYYSSFEEREVFVSQQSLKSLPDSLIYLHWDDYPSKSLPSNFCPENLVELCMPNSHVEQLWNGVQNLVKLKRLDLNSSQQLIKIPDLSKATNLEIISLGGCTSLVEVPSSIGYLNNLCWLDVGHCKHFGNFSFIYHNTFDFSSKITKFPNIPRYVENLCLCGTAIEEVPSSIECLSKLKYLCLRHCRRLKKLPSSICKLKCLEHLDLYDCLKLESFPEILETMAHVDFLDLSGTPIEELPSSIEHLVGLKILWLNNCKKLKNLPSSSKLNSLQYLSLINCSNITKFPEIPGNLRDLYLSTTTIAQMMSSIECYSKLREVHLEICAELDGPSRIIIKLEPPEFYAKLGNLRRYNFKSKPHGVFYLSGFTKLEFFQEHLGTVEEVNPLDGTTETSNLRYDFRWLTKVYCFSNLSLNDLQSLRNCIGNLKFLVKLNVSNSSVFEELPNNLENLRCLTHLSLRFCNLSKFSLRLTCISTLTVLDLSGNNFERVPASIYQLLKLERLVLNYCKRLQSLPELPPYLQYLDAHECTSLEVVSFAINYQTPTRFYRKNFMLTNCINLDQKAILTNTQLHILQMAIGDVKLYHWGRYPISLLHICYPGSEIPEWFNCQNLGSCVTTLLPPYLHDHNDQKFVGFALCIVVSFDYLRDSDVEYRCNFKINGDDCHNFSSLIYPFNGCFIGSDHVFLVYNFNLYHNYKENAFRRFLQKPFALQDDESNYEASFEFSVCKPSGDPVDYCMVKKCGVRPLYGQVPVDTCMFKTCGVRPLYGQVPHTPSERESESDAESECESDAGECNPLMIQPSSPYDPMVEDGTTTKRPGDDELSGNFISDEEEEPRLKRLK